MQIRHLPGHMPDHKRPHNSAFKSAATSQQAQEVILQRSGESWGLLERGLHIPTHFYHLICFYKHNLFNSDLQLFQLTPDAAALQSTQLEDMFHCLGWVLVINFFNSFFVLKGWDNAQLRHGAHRHLVDTMVIQWQVTFEARTENKNKNTVITEPRWDKQTWTC